MVDYQWSYLRLTDGATRRGVAYPSNAQGALPTAPLTGAARAIVTADDLFLWRETTITHAMFMHVTDIDGLRLRLAPGVISVHQEAIAFPEHFSFVYKDVEAVGEQDLEMRRSAVGRWLRSNAHLRTIHPGEFLVDGYM
jgi:hypothetical protein